MKKNTEKEKRNGVHKKDNATNKRGASNLEYIEWA